MNIIPWLVIFAAMLIITIILEKNTKLTFSIRVFIAMILGMGLGLALHFWGNDEATGEVRKWFSLIGYGYVDLLRMLIIPLVPTSIIVGLMNLKSENELKQMLLSLTLLMIHLFSKPYPMFSFREFWTVKALMHSCLVVHGVEILEQ